MPSNLSLDEMLEFSFGATLNRHSLLAREKLNGLKAIRQDVSRQMTPNRGQFEDLTATLEHTLFSQIGVHSQLGHFLEQIQDRRRSRDSELDLLREENKKLREALQTPLMQKLGSLTPKESEDLLRYLQSPRPKGVKARIGWAFTQIIKRY